VPYFLSLYTTGIIDRVRKSKNSIVSRSSKQNLSPNLDKSRSENRIRLTYLSILVVDMLAVLAMILTITLPVEYQNEIWVLLTSILSLHCTMTFFLLRYFMRSTYSTKRVTTKSPSTPALNSTVNIVENTSHMVLTSIQGSLSNTSVLGRSQTDFTSIKLG